jgi:thiamine biosynthesis lipoprotein
MGTVVTVDVRMAPRAAVPAAMSAVAARLRAIDRDLSTWSADSWVSRIAAGAVPVHDCPGEVREVLALADDLAVLTGGRFSPYWHGRPGAPDPTGLVKGWAAQQASDILLQHGLPDHLVNAAGDVVLSGLPGPASGNLGERPMWRVGVSDPGDAAALACVVTLPAGRTRWAVATSGTGQQGRHVTDPLTRTWPGAVASATAVVPLDAEHPEAGATADACATALVAAGAAPDDLIAALGGHGIRALLIDADGRRTDPHGVCDG